MFDPAMQQILSLARQLWGFLAGLLIVVAMLGGLYYVLQGAAGASFGGSRMVSTAVLGMIGLALMVLLAFLFLPQLGQMLRGLQPPPPF